MGVGGSKVLPDTQRLAWHRPTPEKNLGKPVRPYRERLTAIIAASGMVITIVATFAVYSVGHPAQAGHSAQRQGLPTTPGSHIGRYTHGAPYSFVTGLA
jgi:hypothetical protein